MWLLMGGMTAAAADAPSFSNRSLQGAYGVIASGTLDGQSAIAVARYTFDGTGNCSLVATVNIAAAGGQGPITATSCTYAVQPDGTGTLSVDLPSLGLFNLAFVIVKNGTEVYMITVDPNVSATVLLKKQSTP
jgi:hypothetical protein